MLKIVKQNQSIFTENLVVVLFGSAGAGKTSLAYSAKNPLCFDFDLGSQRAVGRKDAVRVQNWADIEQLEAKDLEGYDTIIVDTVGCLLDCLTQHVAARDPKLIRKTGELTLQGYGALGVAFKAWVTKIKSYKKDIILISHEKEEKIGDNTYVRLDIAGSTKGEVLKMADLLGYLYMSGSNRTLDFNPTEFHLGKNCVGFDVLTLPHIVDNQQFLAELIEKTKQHMNAKSEEQVKLEAEFNKALEIINSAQNAEDINKLVGVEIIKTNQALRQKLSAKTKKLNLVPNADTKQYELAQSAEEQ